MRKFPYFLPVFILLTAVSFAKTHVEIAKENSATVVTVNVAKRDGSTFSGTGFIVNPSGLIVTNKHVVENAIFINITFNTGAISGEAKVAARSKDVDLVILKINAKNLPVVTIGDSDYTLPGEEITVIGSPRRLQNTITSGLISQVRLMKNKTVLHQISAPISPSSSGSPVFNNKGEVVSIAFSSYAGEDNQNLNFAIPSKYLMRLMDSKNFAYKSPEVALPVKVTPLEMIRAHIKKSWDILIKYLGFKS
ncbi:Trypsin-like peptidase domain-containing protein [Parelusimicrobium proximum]|uniref:S1C family serine protease n=1 Tax=Parelusimicrobium proximum TaxID=3228953 RepID=UPI003D16AC2F